MEQIPAILPPIANWIMLALGIILIVLEVSALNFFILLWFGIAAILVGIWGFFSPFAHGEYQLIATAILGTVLLLLFRKHFLPDTTNTTPLETFKSGGSGRVIQQDGLWMIEYQGTWWRIANPSDALKEGQMATVEKVENNQVWIDLPSLGKR